MKNGSLYQAIFYIYRTEESRGQRGKLPTHFFQKLSKCVFFSNNLPKMLLLLNFFAEVFKEFCPTSSKLLLLVHICIYYAYMQYLSFCSNIALSRLSTALKNNSQNHCVAASLTQPTILPMPIKWVPGTPGESVVKKNCLLIVTLSLETVQNYP